MLRGALIGHGFIAEHGHLPAYVAANEAGTPIEIVAVADPCAARRAKALAANPHFRVYEDVGALLKAERDLDFVDISTPPSEHAAIAHAALNKGLHVFCEKPLATSSRDAASMLDHAARARRVLMPSHNYKHAPVVRAVRRALAGGTIGDVHLVTLHTFRNTHAKGVSEWRPDWRRERRYSGGGIAMDHGSHTFYLAFDWLGGFPTAITAKTSTRGTWDTEDDMSCTVTFPKGIAEAHLTWNAGMRRVIYTIHGEKGAIRVEDDDVEIVVKHTVGSETRWENRRERLPSDWMDASHVRWFKSLFEQFTVAIAMDDFVGREALESYKCVELIETAYESARLGSRELPVGSRTVIHSPDHTVGSLVV
jgi:predicted dehydrogenase